MHALYMLHSKHATMLAKYAFELIVFKLYYYYQLSSVSSTSFKC